MKTLKLICNDGPEVKKKHSCQTPSLVVSDSTVLGVGPEQRDERVNPEQKSAAS